MDDRDFFLDCLEDHMHLSQAHIRSYVLGVWYNLYQDQRISHARQHVVLESAAGRLQDETSTVRNTAVQLLTCLLESNAFVAKLETADLELKLVQEKEKLQSMFRMS